MRPAPPTGPPPSSSEGSRWPTRNLHAGTCTLIGIHPGMHGHERLPERPLAAPAGRPWRRYTPTIASLPDPCRAPRQTHGPSRRTVRPPRLPPRPELAEGQVRSPRTAPGRGTVRSGRGARSEPGVRRRAGAFRTSGSPGHSRVRTLGTARRRPAVDFVNDPSAVAARLGGRAGASAVQAPTGACVCTVVCAMHRRTSSTSNGLRRRAR